MIARNFIVCLNKLLNNTISILAHKRESLKQQKQEREISKQKQKQNKQRKQKHSLVSNNNNDSLESLLYQKDESFDILFETLKILGSPQELRKQGGSGNNYYTLGEIKFSKGIKE